MGGGYGHGHGHAYGAYGQDLDPVERRRLLSSASFRGATLLPGSKPQPPSADASANANINDATANPNAFTLTPRDELAALTAFMAALPWNALPAHVDARAPLDPELVLDFDVRRDAARAREELTALRRDTWGVNPVVVFGKVRFFSFTFFFINSFLIKFCYFDLMNTSYICSRDTPRRGS